MSRSDAQAELNPATDESVMLDAAAQAGVKFAEAAKTALMGWLEDARREAELPISAVASKKDGRLPVAAWMRRRGGVAISDAEAAELIQRNWLDAPGIAVPRNAINPIRRADEADDVIPKTIADQVIEELDTFAVVRRVCRVIATESMDRLTFPIFDDRSNTADLITSTIDLANTASPAITSLTLDCKTLSTKPVVLGRTLLRDAAVDIEGIVTRELGARLGRKLNNLLTVGSGTSGQPEGVLTAAPVGKTTASSSAVTWKEVHDLTLAVDPIYYGNAKFMMHQNIAAQFYQLTDTLGQPILWRDPIGSMPDRLFGFPVVYNPDMPSTVSAGEKLILFGDFTRYVLRESTRIVLKVFQELFAQYDGVGFLALYDFDAGLAGAATTKSIAALQVKSTSS